MPVSAEWNIELELAGVGNGWTSVTSDVRPEKPGISCEWGIKGVDALSRVASTGTMTFVLNNGPTNSARTVGYYALDNANVRAGFALGIRCRLGMTYPPSHTYDGGCFDAGCFDENIPAAAPFGLAFDSGTFPTSLPSQSVTNYRFLGTIDKVNSTPGVRGRYLSTITAVDFLDECARYHVTGVGLQLNQRGDQVFSAVVAGMPRQPAAIQTSQGLDSYPYALDNVKDEKTTVLQIFQDLALSELGYIYVRSDQRVGGTLTYESRSVRGKTTSNVQVFSNTMEGMSAPRSRDALINKVQVTAHPRKVDAAASTVLFRLDSATAIGPGVAFTITAPYRDPSQPLARVGGTSMVQPVAATDYKANATADGTSADLTALFSVTADFSSGNTASVLITNNSNTTGYIGGGTAGAFLQLRGIGVYDYNQVILKAENVPNQQQFGQRVVNVNMPYQADPSVANEASSYILNVYSNPLSYPVLSILGNWSDALMQACLLRDISDSVGLDETITGVRSSTRYFINHVRLSITQGRVFRATFTLAPADQNRYWYLEVAGSSELDQSTRLGYGLIVGHNDVAHADLHGDVAHADVVHSDVTHVDVAHADTSHGDSAHSDTAHGDSHSDVSHSDVAHGDVVHDDSHSDAAHADVAHADLHSDSHGDRGVEGNHVDNHGDSHQDSHADVSHSDSHNDTAHSDVAHSDVAAASSHSDAVHADVAHVDGGHQDAGHSDVAHSDVAHQDVTQVNSHSDTSHGDQ